MAAHEWLQRDVERPQQHAVEHRRAHRDKQHREQAERRNQVDLAEPQRQQDRRHARGQTRRALPVAAAGPQVLPRQQPGTRDNPDRQREKHRRRLR